MELGLAGKTVWITGASGGIGRVLAEAFAAEGAQLVLQGNGRFDELTAFVAGRPWTAQALCVRADVSKPDEVERCARAGSERFGRLDVCIAAAGRWPREPRLLHEASCERIRATLDDNLLGAVWTARAFLEQIAGCGPRADQHGAALVFLGSTAGRFGERYHTDYALAKAGLRGLVTSLKNEIVLVDPRGRVNLVEPGWTMTHMVRPELSQPGVVQRVTASMALRQLGAASDVARAALFLASPLAARHVTGEFLSVAGGMEGRTLWSAKDIDEARAQELPAS